VFRCLKVQVYTAYANTIAYVRSLHAGTCARYSCCTLCRRAILYGKCIAIVWQFTMSTIIGPTWLCSCECRSVWSCTMVARCPARRLGHAGGGRDTVVASSHHRRRHRGLLRRLAGQVSTSCAGAILKLQNIYSCLKSALTVYTQHCTCLSRSEHTLTAHCAYAHTLYSTAFVEDLQKRGSAIGLMDRVIAGKKIPLDECRLHAPQLSSVAAPLYTFEAAIRLRPSSSDGTPGRHTFPAWYIESAA
jgi:hypothetical protein